MNLQKRLTIASHLARCQKAINSFRDNETPEEVDWILSLFLFPMENEDRQIGPIALLMCDKGNDSELISVLHLSKKTSKDLTDQDWKIIHNFLLEYRAHLLMKSSWMSQCECDL